MGALSAQVNTTKAALADSVAAKEAVESALVSANQKHALEVRHRLPSNQKRRAYQ